MNIHAIRMTFLISSSVGIFLGGFGFLMANDGTRVIEELYCDGSIRPAVLIVWYVAVHFISFYALVCGLTSQGVIAVSRFMCALQIVVVIPTFLVAWSLLLLLVVSDYWLPWLEFLNPENCLWGAFWVVDLAVVIALYRYYRWLMLRETFVPFAKPDDRAMAFRVFVLSLVLPVSSMFAAFIDFGVCK